jgi:hypothetical protein
MGVNNLKKSTFNIPQEKNLTSKYFRDSSQPLFHENMSCFYSANIFIIFNRACIQQQNWGGGAMQCKVSSSGMDPAGKYL